MVLERITSVKDAVKHPWKMFIVGGFISTICLAISFLIFPSYKGLFFTFLTTICMMPFMVELIRREEEQTEAQIARKMKMSIFRRHFDIVLVYISFFFGMITCLTIIFVMLPPNVTEELFKEQIEELKLIKGEFFGSNLKAILINNIGILLISFFLSLLFAAGAIFIFSWNASIVATTIGLMVRNIGVAKLPLIVLRFLPHGFLEFLAYFVGGIAGGLISTAITKKSKWQKIIIKDSLIYLAIGFLILCVAAFIEVLQL